MASVLQSPASKDGLKGQLLLGFRLRGESRADGFPGHVDWHTVWRAVMMKVFSQAVSQIWKCVTVPWKSCSNVGLDSVVLGGAQDSADDLPGASDASVHTHALTLRSLTF